MNDTATMTLTDFLLARLDVEEQMAKAAGHGYGHQPIGASRNAGWTDLDQTDNLRPSYDVRFVKTWSPDRVLAEIAAKRAIIDEWLAHERATADALAFDLNPSHPDQRRQAVLTVLRYLATPYADHPDYRSEWRARPS